MIEVYFNVYRTPTGIMYQGIDLPKRVVGSVNGGPGNRLCYRVRVKFKTDQGAYTAPHFCAKYRSAYK